MKNELLSYVSKIYYVFLLKKRLNCRFTRVVALWVLVGSVGKTVWNGTKRYGV